MKKVAHLTSVHARYDNRVLLKECVTLARLGYEVFLIVADGKGDETYQGVKILDVGAPRSLRHRMTRITYRIYSKARELKADIYHFHDPELIPFALLLKREARHVIYDVHEDYSTALRQKSYLHPRVSGFLAGLFSLFERKAARKFGVILAEKYYRERFPGGELILNYPLLPNGAQASVELSAAETLQASLGQGSSDAAEEIAAAQLLYTGNVTEERGAYLQARLVRDIPEVHVHFIGKCHPALAEKILQTAGPGRERLTIKGVGAFVSPVEIEAAYREGVWLAGLALFPRSKHYEKKELTKFFEYMKHGIPVICSDFAVWKELVEENGCGLAVNPYDMEEIREAIDYLKKNPGIRREMGQNGRSAVLNKYNWGREAQKLGALYRSLT